MNDLATRRNEIDSELASLRQQRGAATLDGKKFDASKISALEAEAVALSEAEGEQARRDREAAAERLEAERATARKELAKLEDERQRALQDANAHARGLAEAIEIALDKQGRMAKVAQVIAGGRTPRALHIPDFVSRIGGRLASIMKTIPGHPARLGAIEWKGASLYAPFDDWREKERAALEPQLKPLINEGKENDKN